MTWNSKARSFSTAVQTRKIPKAAARQHAAMTGAENAANEENASCSRFAQTSGCVWRMYTPNEAVEKNEMNLHTALFCTLIRMKKANSATEDSTMNTEV